MLNPEVIKQVCPFGLKCQLIGIDEGHTETFEHPHRLDLFTVDEHGRKTKLPPIQDECTGPRTCRCHYRCAKGPNNQGCLQGKSHDHIKFFVQSVKHLRNPQFSDAVFKYADVHLKVGDKRACVDCLKAVLDCPNNKLYTPQRSLSMTDTVPKDVSILSWFRSQLFCLDVDPTDGSFTLPCARKASVWKWYEEDANKHPTCYAHVSKSYFFGIWRQYYPNVKCRKWLRFAKCTTCVQLREKKHDRTLPKAERAEAEKTLKRHYEAMKRERAYHKE